jgi:hypothetical protein
MPYSIRKRGNGYEVVNRDTGEVHAKHTTRAKAQAQVRLLRGTEHGWHPTGRPVKVKHLSNGTRVNVYVKRGRGKGGTKRT